MVDGGASMRCALLGDQLAASGVKNGWSVSVTEGQLSVVQQCRLTRGWDV